jgi:hypothetical protein
MGFKPVFTNQKTTVKKKVLNGDYLASEFDNIFYNSALITVNKKNIIPFYQQFLSLEKASQISDHIPIWIEFSMK